MVANIIDHHDIIDYEKSNLTYDEDQEEGEEKEIEFIRSLAFVATSEMKLPSIFRLSSFILVLVINTAIKEAFEANNVTGFKIYKPEEYSLP